MSALEDLHGLESRVVARMEELRPLVAEYNELEEVARRLGLKVAAPSAAPPAASPARTRTVRRARAASKAAPRTRAKAKPRGSTAATAGTASQGGRRQQIVDLVTERPGISVRQIGQEFGVDPTNLYRIVRGLERDGTLKKQGSELLPG